MNPIKISQTSGFSVEQKFVGSSGTKIVVMTRRPSKHPQSNSNGMKRFTSSNLLEKSL